MKILAISDTHCNHKKIKLPSEHIDVMIHCGDISNSSDSNINRIEVLDFLDWYNNINAIQYKILIAGNHDVILERKKDFIKNNNFNNIIYLQDSEIIIDNIKFYGSPYTSTYGKSWAFMKKTNQLEKIWKKIPDNIDILITHGPPKGILDLSIDKQDNIKQVGCPHLLNRIINLNLSTHCFGHIHTNYRYKLFNNGIIKYPDKNISFINAACTSFPNKEITNNGIIYQI